jgi:hypothetical protein
VIDCFGVRLDLEEGLAQQGWPFFLEIEGEEQVIREINAFTKPLTPLAAVCILNPAIFSRRPCGRKALKQRNRQHNQNSS